MSDPTKQVTADIKASEAREVSDEGKAAPKRRFDKRDFDYLAESIISEYERRKGKRKSLEKQWADIDRQIAMQPDIGFKLGPKGAPDVGKMWMSEMELPLQAQALEVLVTDARRFAFPDSGVWFSSHAELTDEYLSRIDFESLILGDEGEVPSKINQDNADKLVTGFLMNMFRQYDLPGRIDRINAEAFKYSEAIGRMRMETKSLYMHEARGTLRRDKKIPVLVPVSIKNCYLDDQPPSLHSARVISDSHIFVDYIKLENIALAASRGSNDPRFDDGGWMPKTFANLKADDRGYVTLLEMEGDVIVPRKTQRSFVIPNAIVTVAIGGKEAGGIVSKGVVRFRLRKTPYSSYIRFPYLFEGIDDTYAASPLMKGRPLQMTATNALNRLMDGAALKNAPPVSWDKNDIEFAASGGPEIYPYARWGSTEPIRVHAEVGGDPNAMSAIMQSNIQLHAELTGVLPARLGAQSVSHTTAFAKDAELQRGSVRTIGYVNRNGQHNGLARVLDITYDLARNALGNNEPRKFYIDSYGGFVEIKKKHLPDAAEFEWFGAGGPAEEQQKKAAKIGALQTALQIDSLAQQTGRPPRINTDAAIDQLLREGGWTDIDVITNQEAEQRPQSFDQQANPGLATVALQQLGAE